MTDPAERPADHRWLAYGVAFVALVAAGTLIAKYQLIEPVPYASACERHEGPWFGCFVRGVFVVLFVKNVAGMASTVFGVWSTVTRTRALAFAAVAMGAVSIILYRFDAAVVGVMLGLLVLARAAVPRPQQHQRAEEAESR